jgi:DNA-directed RNA polymerase subunit RPC12/RpoP
MKKEKEAISLWILEQKRQENRLKSKKELADNYQNEKYHCHSCKKAFAEPKLIQYFACPHCKKRLEKDTKRGCQHWFGFLSEKEKKDSVPAECVECVKVLDCMLINYHNSERAVSEIKKWY